LAVTKAKVKGMLADGGGLYLQVGDGRAKSWIFRFKRSGAERWMGLGSAGEVSLADAREGAAACRRQLRDGVDPLASREAIRGQANAEAAKAITFKQCAEKYIDAHRSAWRNAKHAAQWSTTLATYAEPVLGELSIAAIDTGRVLAVLEPIWTTRAETARRLRGRIEAVLDWATARGYRQGENPARWRGHINKLLPARSRARAVQHHPALPYDELAAFMAMLRAEDGVAAKALEFLILTVGRTGEVIGAEWPEIDFKAKAWNVPGERMKSSRPHRVPLSAPAIAVVEALRGRDAKIVFPGGKPKHPLSSMAMLALLERMGRDDLTVHGFRSTFRDWAAERTNYAREVAEMALAHAIGDKVEAAYRRGDLFEKRRRLMDEWGRYCSATKARGAVVPMRHAKS
jgi:integrase